MFTNRAAQKAQALVKHRRAAERDYNQIMARLAQFKKLEEQKRETLMTAKAKEKKAFKMAVMER
jgi:hypothetical protein